MAAVLGTGNGVELSAVASRTRPAHWSERAKRTLSLCTDVVKYSCQVAAKCGRQLATGDQGAAAALLERRADFPLQFLSPIHS